jgi:aminoglycoside phosphotransferase (APT) family kinase protein
VPWFAGTASDVTALNSDQAARLAKFLRALHVSAPAGAPLNTVRGVPLMHRRVPAEERMQRLATETDFVTADIRRIWNHALEAPLDVQSTWLHGDLHAQNVLVEAGVISAVIDWGDICQGDRATDLSAIWMVLDDRKAREEAMRIYGDVSDATWSRARGWALMVATILLDTGLAGNQRHAAMGARVYARLAEGP